MGYKIILIKKIKNSIEQQQQKQRETEGSQLIMRSCEMI